MEVTWLDSARPQGRFHTTFERSYTQPPMLVHLRDSRQRAVARCFCEFAETQTARQLLLDIALLRFGLPASPRAASRQVPRSWYKK